MIGRAAALSGPPRILLLICAVLAVVVLAEYLLWPKAAVPPRATGAIPLSAAPVLDPAQMPPLAAFAETAARPLFLPSRRPPPPELADAISRTAPRLPPMGLAGVILSEKGRFAILEYGNPPKPLRAIEGQEVGGWLVEAIHSDRVILRNGETTTELVFQDKAPARGANRPAAQRPARTQPQPQPPR